MNKINLEVKLWEVWGSSSGDECASLLGY